VQAFAALIEDLDATTGSKRKVALIRAFLTSQPAADGAWALQLLIGQRRRRLITGRRLREILLSCSVMPDWLFAECHGQVGDSAETVALLWPQVQALLEAWLDAKAAILAGKDSRMPVEGLARASLVGRLEAERASDQARGETQTISTSITGLTIEERDTNRIAATVILSYSDQRLNAKGDPEGEPTKLQLRNRYVFGREGGIWRVANFSKAP